jgi:hypothetical protein
VSVVPSAITVNLAYQAFQPAFPAEHIQAGDIASARAPRVAEMLGLEAP